MPNPKPAEPMAEDRMQAALAPHPGPTESGLRCPTLAVDRIVNDETPQATEDPIRVALRHLIQDEIDAALEARGLWGSLTLQNSRKALTRTSGRGPPYAAPQSVVRSAGSISRRRATRRSLDSGRPVTDYCAMSSPEQPRTTALDRDIAAARRRALNERPFTPEWSVAVAEVEELERVRWRRELLATGGYVPPRRRLLSWFARAGRSAAEGAP